MRIRYTLLSVLMGLLCLGNYAEAQVQVSTGGPPLPYTTLKAAFDAINAGAHTGAVLVEITGNTTETAQPTLNASGVGAASYTSVVLRPTVVASITATYADSAVVRLLGADNVTINGAINGVGTSRDLTIEHNGANNGATAVWLSSPSTSDGCFNVTIRNCVLRGGSESGTSTAGVRATGTGNTITSGGSLHNNLQVINNKIERATNGVVLYGTSANPSTGFLVQGNDVGSATVGNRIRVIGIYAYYAPGAVIEGNIIHDLTMAPAASTHAVQIGGSNAVSKNCVVRNNTILEIRNPNTGGYGAYGVNVAAGDSTMIYNNFISGISTLNYSSTSTSFNPFGIRIAAGVGHRILYNSVYMHGDHTASTTNPVGAALLYTPTAVDAEIRNNIFANTSTSTVAGKFYAVWFSATTPTFASTVINNNAYMVPAVPTGTTNYYVARTGTTTSLDYADLAALQTLTGQDGNSVPPTNGQALGFTSLTDLHIPAATPSFYESNASPIAGITTDIDGDVRNAATPDIGADEFAGASVGDFAGPDVANIAASPTGNQCAPTARTISADVTDPSGVATVVIRYTINGGAPIDVPMTLGTAPTYTGTIPAQGAGESIAWSIVATDAATGANVTTATGGTYTDAYLQVNIVGQANPLCANTPYNFLVASPSDPLVRFTEIVHFRTGTGATSPYPATIGTGDDLVEITNFSPVAVNLSGFIYELVGVGPRTYTFPATAIIPPGGVLVLHIGTGTDAPANLFFNTGGTSNSLLSTSSAGHILRTSGGNVIDAVGTGTYTFLPASGVTAVDWSGTIGSMTSGISLLTTDNNNAASWTINNAGNLGTMGTPNTGAALGSVGGAGLSYTWNVGGFTTAGITTTFTASQDLIVNVTDGNCSVADTLAIVVTPPAAAPTLVGDAVCGGTPANLTATAPGPVTWYSDAAALNPVGTGSPFNPVVSAQDTFWATWNDGTCNSQIAFAVVTFTNPQAVSLTAPASICVGETATFTASSTGTYAYTWTGNSLAATTGNTVTASPTASGTYTYTLEGVDGTCLFDTSFTLNVQPAPVFPLADTIEICSGTSATLAVSALGDNPVRITEFNVWRTGTGATNPYPAAFPTSDYDLLELTNQSNAPFNLSGFTVEVVGEGARSYTFPSVVLPAGGVLVLNIGTNTDDPANFYYNTGGANNAILSTELSGFILRAPGGGVVDALAINGYTFLPASGVTASDWSGNIPSMSGLAGCSRNGIDNNLASDWVLSSASLLQTIGSLNAGLNILPSNISYLWTPGGQTTNLITVSPTVNTTYSVTADNGTCTYTDSVVVEVLPIPATPVVAGDAVCGNTPFEVFFTTGVGTTRWYNVATGGTPIATTDTLTGVLAATDTFYVEDFNGVCASARTMVIVTHTLPADVSPTVTPGTICPGQSATLNVTSTNAGYQYSWSGPELAATAGASVTVSPSGALNGQTLTYTVMATDGVCSTDSTIQLAVSFSPVFTLADTLQLCSGNSVTLGAYGLGDSPLRITEITPNRPGTGATSPYPAFLASGDNDFIEITNQGVAPYTIAGEILQITGVGARYYNLPSVTLPPSGVMIIHPGTGTDDPANFYFHTAGSNNPLSSTSSSGFILRNNDSTIIDAVAINSHTFPVADNVTVADWSGNVASASGLAGISRNGPDNNLASDWTLSSVATPQTIGTPNPGLTVPTATANTYVWTPGGQTTNTITVSPTASTVYTVSADNGACVYTDSVLVQVFNTPATPVTADVTVCGNTPANLTATGINLEWYDAATAGNLVGTGSPFSVVVAATDTFYVQDVAGICPSPRAMAIVTRNTAASVTPTVNPAGGVCIGGSVSLSASSTNAAYTYTWSVDGTVIGTGTPLSYTVNSPSLVELTATDGVCTFDTFAVLNLNPSPVVEITGNLNLCAPGNTTLTASYTATRPVIITEVAQQHTSATAGYTQTLPPYIGAALSDLVELTNISNVNQDLSNLILEVAGGGTHFYTFPAGTVVPPMGVVVVHLGTGTDDPANLFFNTGSTSNQITIAEATEYILRDPAFNVLDAVVTNNFATSVTPADWTGNLSTTGAAGVWLNGADVNNNTTWVAGNNTTRLTIGSLNPGLLPFGTSAPTFAWQPGGQTTASITENVTATTDYILTVTNPATGCQFVDTVTVSVEPLGVTVTPSSVSVCPGTAVTLTANAVGGDGVYTYNWVGQANTTNTLTFTPTGDGNIAVEVTSPGCGPGIVSDSAAIDVLDAPLVLAAIADTTLCTDGTVVLNYTASATGGGVVNGVTYTWDNGLPAQASVSITPAAASNVSYTVEAEDACGNITTESFSINAPAAIDVVVSGGGTICEGTDATLTAAASGGDGNFTFTWDNGAGTGDVVTVSPTGNTTYTVTVTDGVGICDATGSASVVVSPLPVAAFTVDATNEPVIDFTDGSTDATTYAWSFGDGVGTSTSQSPQYTYTTNGVYDVMLIATNACGSDTAINQVTITVIGAADALLGASLGVYPNPVAQHTAFNLNIAGVNAPTVQVETLNALGQVVGTQQVALTAGAAQTTVSVAGLSAGLYTVRVSAPSGVWTTKLVVR